MKKCSNCRFSKGGQSQVFRGVVRNTNHTICRRHPPVSEVQLEVAKFPIVDMDSWCGEWQAPPMGQPDRDEAGDPFAAAANKLLREHPGEDVTLMADGKKVGSVKVPEQ